MAYDIIGDIHGEAEALENLLENLGYKESAGVYEHKNRQVIFVGDLIDRGPNNRRVVQIAKSMTEADNAKTIMGNHEFNALCFHTKDEDGQYLRPRNDKNTQQHKAFLLEYSEGSKILLETLDWFKSLPIFIEEDIRIIHACWDQGLVDFISPQLNSDKSMTNEFFKKAATKDTDEFDAIEVLLKGAEAKLPDGIFFFDKDGNKREETRLQWWLKSPQTYQNVALVPKETKAQLPKTNVPEENMVTYSPDQKPVFFGHYWMKEDPEKQTDNICCLDYSIAKGGKLCAYRWSGEKDLNDDNFVWVEGK